MNDDVKIIWGLAGYPGNGDPSPFMVYSNILLGLALAPLYGLRTSVNWFTVLLIILDICSVWAVLSLVFAIRRSVYAALIASIVIAAGAATLTINLTYTVTAFLAALAGICLLFAAARIAGSRWNNLAILGLILIFVGSLLRPPMLLMVTLIAAPGLAASAGTISYRRILLYLAVAGGIVGLGLVFDRLYVRTSPDWNAFYAHTRVRQQVHDSHRLNNVHNEIRRIGWTPNDQELFAHWFYPDESRYSVEKLRYLAQKVPAASQDPWASISATLRSLLLIQHVPYLLLMLGIGLGAFAEGRPPRMLIALALTWMIAVGLNIGLSVLYKDPSYVLGSTLAGSVTLSIVILGLQPDPDNDRTFRRAEATRWRRAGKSAAVLLITLGVVASGVTLLRHSTVNVRRQTDYGRIRAEMDALTHSGRLPKDAIVISPAHGLPFEWSSPFRLDLPSPAYLDTGWITFSPSYYRTLDVFDIASVPLALVQREDVFLMAESSFTRFLARYYEEHLGSSVAFERIYAMPNPSGLPGYDGISLFRVTIAR